MSYLEYFGTFWNQVSNVVYYFIFRHDLLCVCFFIADLSGTRGTRGRKGKGTSDKGLGKKREKTIKIYFNAKTVDFLLIRNVANGLIPEKNRFAKGTSNGHVVDILTGHGRYP